jgi:hypothetical protein
LVGYWLLGNVQKFCQAISAIRQQSVGYGRKESAKIVVAGDHQTLRCYPTLPITAGITDRNQFQNAGAIPQEFDVEIIVTKNIMP